MSYLFLQSTYMHDVFVVNYYFTYIRFVLNMTVHGCKSIRIYYFIRGQGKVHPHRIHSSASRPEEWTA